MMNPVNPLYNPSSSIQANHQFNGLCKQVTLFRNFCNRLHLLLAKIKTTDIECNRFHFAAVSINLRRTQI